MNTKLNLIQSISAFNLVNKLSVTLYKRYIEYTQSHITSGNENIITEEQLSNITQDFLYKILNERGIDFSLKDNIVTFQIKDFKRFLLLSNTQTISILKSLEKAYNQDFLYQCFIADKYYKCLFASRLEDIIANLPNLLEDSINIITLSTRIKISLQETLDKKIRQCLACALLQDIVPYCHILSFIQSVQD